MTANVGTSEAGNCIGRNDMGSRNSTIHVAMCDNMV